MPSSSWKRTSQHLLLLVEKGNHNHDFPPPTVALLGVREGASQGAENGYGGSLDEEKASNDEDEPDD